MGAVQSMEDAIMNLFNVFVKKDGWDLIVIVLNVLKVFKINLILDLVSSYLYKFII